MTLQSWSELYQNSRSVASSSPCVMVYCTVLLQNVNTEVRPWGGGTSPNIWYGGSAESAKSDPTGSDYYK